MTPSPLLTVVLALATLRTYRLVALDTFPPIMAARDRLVGVVYADEGYPTEFRRPLVADWLTCVWCSGLWWATGWYTAWLLWPAATVYAAVPLALSAAAGIAQSFLPS